MAVGLANIGPPSPSMADDGDYNVLQGLSLAVEGISRMTPLQESYVDSEAHKRIPLINNGRIIVFTHLKKLVLTSHCQCHVKVGTHFIISS